MLLGAADTRHDLAVSCIALGTGLLTALLLLIVR